jgi:2-oxoglutarate ferredoxin oxidoreductase subunit alpha
MYAKRMRKEEVIIKEVSELEPYRLYGEGKDTLITWGSTFGAVFEVAEELGYKVLAVRYLRPLILPELKGGELIAVECNYSGLLTGLVEREKCVTVRRVLRWDGRPFTPEELRESLEVTE